MHAFHVRLSPERWVLIGSTPETGYQDMVVLNALYGEENVTPCVAGENALPVHFVNLWEFLNPDES